MSREEEAREERQRQHQKRRQRRKRLKELEHERQDDPTLRALIDVRGIARQEYVAASDVVRSKRRTLAAARCAVVGVLEDFLPDELQTTQKPL